MNFKKTGKIITLICILAMTLTVFAGCGSDKKENKGDQTLIAVTEATYPPFDTTDDEGNIVGFDMDLLNAIAKDQGFKVEYKSMEFDSLIPAVEAGNADIIAAAMTKDDPNRQKKVDFSNSYYDSSIVVMVKADNDQIKNGIKDFKPDMTVAAQIGTTSEKKILELKKKGKIKDVKINNGNDICIQQLNQGNVDAVMIDEPVAKKFMEKFDGLAISGAPLTSDQYGFATSKDNKELMEKINAGLKNLQESGEYDQIYNKWFDWSAEK